MIWKRSFVVTKIESKTVGESFAEHKTNTPNEPPEKGVSRAINDNRGAK